MAVRSVVSRAPAVRGIAARNGLPELSPKLFAEQFENEAKVAGLVPIDTPLRDARGKHFDLRHCFHCGPRPCNHALRVVHRFAQGKQHSDGKHRGTADTARAMNQHRFSGLQSIRYIVRKRPEGIPVVGTPPSRISKGRTEQGTVPVSRASAYLEDFRRISYSSVKHTIARTASFLT
jgi:hypothetical protein